MCGCACVGLRAFVCLVQGRFGGETSTSHSDNEPVASVRKRTRLQSIERYTLHLMLPTRKRTKRQRHFMRTVPCSDGRRASDNGVRV